MVRETILINLNVSEQKLNESLGRHLNESSSPETV